MHKYRQPRQNKAIYSIIVSHNPKKTKNTYTSENHHACQDNPLSGGHGRPNGSSVLSHHKILFQISGLDW